MELISNGHVVSQTGKDWIFVTCTSILVHTMNLEPEKGPLFLQIAREISRWVARGDLHPGSRLPPVRDLAKIFRVNPNTIVHALEELERRGITAVRRGLGTYIRDDLDPDMLKRALLEEAIREFLDEVTGLGLSPEEALAALKEVADVGAPEGRE